MIILNIKNGFLPHCFSWDSKVILHYASDSKKTDSKFIIKLVKEAFIKFNLKNAKKSIKILLTDRGSEIKENSYLGFKI